MDLMDLVNILRPFHTIFIHFSHTRRRWELLLVSAILIFLMTSHQSHAQRIRNFPPLMNVAVDKPVSTNPASSRTCGLTRPNAYCLSSDNVSYIDTCRQGYCFQACAGRTSTPPFWRMLTGVAGPGICVVSDRFNLRPNSTGGESVWFTQSVNTSGCYFTPTYSPNLAETGVVSFTIAAWVWLDMDGLGTLLEKQTASGAVLFSLRVSSQGLNLLYGEPGDNSFIASVDVRIPLQTWTHVTVQVYDVVVSVYVNGPGPLLAPAQTVTLVGNIRDDVGSYRIGQGQLGAAQFVGRMQDLLLYTTALSNREIAQVYSGVFPKVRIQSECRCPGIYPRVKPQSTHNCIKNDALANTDDFTLRISRDSHPLEYINDGDSSSLWISNFDNNLDVEIDLGDQFQVFYVVLQFYSSFPKAMIISRQKVLNGPYEPWQYYADDCFQRFGLANNGPFATPDSVNCLQFGTYGFPIPYSKGNITFNLLAPDPVARPGSGAFYSTPELHEFVRATKVKITFEDHYYVKNDRHKYYGVYEVLVTAWCDCNGHASSCNTITLPYTCNCQDTSNTEGARCDRCKPLFNNKPFRKGDNLNSYPCKPCECYGHAQSCVYNPAVDPSPDSYELGGGGVCVNCQDNTAGNSCETCIDNFYRPNGVSLYDPNVCQPCNCDPLGVVNGNLICAKIGGQCQCKANVQGLQCNTCKPGFYGLSAALPEGCAPCDCSPMGVINGANTCDQVTGQCICKANVQGLRCDECKFGFYGMNASNPLGCSSCNCNPFGSTSIYCNPDTGQCQCKDKVEGLICDSCKDEFFNFTGGCEPCRCNSTGSQTETVCDKANGQCFCKNNVEGIYCDSCKEGTFNFGASEELGCEQCPCFRAGTVNSSGSCNPITGECFCKENVEGQGCDRCKPNNWGLNASDPLGCQSCDCDPTGTLLGTVSVCDQNTGQCACLSNRQGRLCDTCARGFYINPFGSGCSPCDCNSTGTLLGTSCDAVTGQCECKTNFGVGGVKCDQCLPGFTNFDRRRGVCSSCNCLPAGSLNDTCDAVTGQCDCKELVQGLSCDRCKTGSSQLTAENAFGCSTNPSQQPPPENLTIGTNFIAMKWRPPDFPNGVILRYNVYRDNTLIATTPGDDEESRMYTDVNLNPFTYYSYVVEAVNAHGSNRSQPAVFQTLPGEPTSDMQLTISDVRARNAFCTWTPPSFMNGPLLKYVILSEKGGSNETVEEWEGTQLSVMLTDLDPYTRYTLRVRACTVGGCADSAGKEILTLSAAPEGQAPPVITPIDGSSLQVSWQPPAKPNGVIISYELWFRGTLTATGEYSPPERMIFNPFGQLDPLKSPDETILDPPATSYNVTGLEPFTVYGFQVVSQNDAGKAASIWQQGRTLEAFPRSVEPPFVEGVSSTELLLTWSTPLPSDAQGEIVKYRLYQNVKLDPSKDPFGPPFVWMLVYDGGGTVMSHTVSGLTPYSEHTFILEACNSIGCVNSTAISGRTLLAAPQGVQTPIVDGYNTTAMEIKWSEPRFPNGPPPSYKVEKTNIALSYPASVVRGTRFTGGGYYAFSPSVIPQNVPFTGIRFRFRLQKGTGILLFTATSTQEEFIALQFTNGRPKFLFDTQGCQRIASVTTTNDEGLVYNDRKWHSFEARRQGITGTVRMDDRWSGQSFIRDGSCQDTSIIGPTTAVYIGGFPPDFVLRRNDRTLSIETSPLQGCIDNVEILQQVYPQEVWATLDWSQGVTNDLAFLNWQGCPINLEPGFHFMGKGYLVLKNCDETSKCEITGDKIEIRLRMRTALHTGLLFLVYGGAGTYMYSVLDNGRLRFAFSDNNDRTVVVYDSPAVNFCDGQWRTLLFTKQGQAASISVLQGNNVTLGDPNVPMPLTLTSPLHLGGLKPGSEALQFVQFNGLLIPNEGFGGCMSGLLLNNEQFEVTILDVANTNMDGCPPFHIPDDTCQSSLITEVYQGMETVAYDTGLLPYTDYIYRVIAANEAGEGYSPWGYGRTKEGAPSGVKGPMSTRAISGNAIEVMWEEPDFTYGLLTKFIVNAYVEDGRDNATVSREIEDVSITAVNMTGVTPNTTYLVRIVACTRGGCSESETGMTVSTPIEAPLGVPAPTADVGPTYLFVQWDPPSQPNGPITGYFLYQEGVQIYSGGQLSFNVTGLRVYTAYNFYISACTVTGCTNGPTVSLSTGQLPPSSINAPTLEVLDTSRVNVIWERPALLNGMLESYLIYLSETDGELGQVVHNSSVLLTNQVVDGLTAGTMYYFVVGACTGGGCTLSPASSTTTEESSPEGVQPPTVTALSPSELVVTWEPPTNPNGEITQYILTQNGVEVYRGLGRTYSVSGLEPYSLHAFRVQACTVQGCAMSEVVEARTLETAPQGNIVLTAQVNDPRSVNVSWTPPERANGLFQFRVIFTGLFYEDPDNWDYTIINDSQVLLETELPNIVYTVGPLVPMSDYRIRVNGSNLVGFILSNIVNVTMPPSCPLVPLSDYRIRVNGSNLVGFILSNIVNVTMPPSFPDGMAPPTVVSNTPYSVAVTWQPVGRVNAMEIPAYVVQFMETTEGALLQDIFGPTVNLAYTHTGLTPFTEYMYRIKASNSYGSVESPWTSVVTRQDTPSSMSAPIVASIGARYVEIMWNEPLSSNGIIINYNIYVSTGQQIEVDANQTSFVVDKLSPYTFYTFDIEACTLAGCTRSPPSSSIRTLQDIPQGLSVPQLLALSPSAIEVKWTEPSMPNGIITQYSIERKSGTDINGTVLAVRLPTASKIFIDESNELRPFQRYSYRVNVQNRAGTALGPWAEITTGSSRPAGLSPPIVTSASPTSAQVAWSPPIQPNGALEVYVINFPEPKVEVRDVSRTSVLVENLIPYTNYSVTLTACTTGGCSESSPTPFTTPVSIPAGQAPPNPTATSQSRIFITWQPPQFPNGPNIGYELSRMKVRQPLDNTVTDIGTWSSVYRGPGLNYEDQNLPMFTTYMYRVTVFNNVSQTISDASPEVTTFGGLPRVAPQLSASPIDHLSIRVNWTLPSPMELQGDVESLQLQVVSTDDNVTQSPSVDVTETVVGELQPNTQYTVTLQVVIFGGASITSDPEQVTTLDGAPTGLAAPQLSVVSNTALRVSWTAPANPNGQIIAYNVLVDDRKINTDSALPGSLVVSDLQPFTVYSFRIEACTVFSCTLSPVAQGTTTEAPPQNLAPPVVTAVSATQVQVVWTAPLIPNGVIQRYDLRRKTLQSCADVPAPTLNPELQKCTYVECGIFENLCGSVCYSGSKVCCEGQLYDSQPDYACCGSSYVYKAKFDYVCCSGQFYMPQPGYVCCGSRYLQVLPGQICCPDTVENRVAISQGDSCCGSIPYSATGSQICCNGQLVSGFGRQCCNGEVTSDTTQCCGDADNGQVYLQDPAKVCCGLEYVDSSTSTCCVSDTGHTKVHLYTSPQEKQDSSDKCCGLSLITNNLQCCNYVGYNPLTQVCADNSQSQSGCGTGVVCPVSQSATAQCNRCDFTSNSLTCGSFTGSLVAPPTTPNPTDTCTTETEIVYSGLNLTYQDMSLSPFSQYEYSVTAVNSAGSLSSDYVAVQTLETVPEQVYPPSTVLAPSQLYVIKLVWREPGKPNGVITEYILRRDGVELYRGLSTNFTDDLNILPYRSYSYTLSVCNTVGCTESSMITVATAQAIPEDLPPPRVTVVSSTSLSVQVQPPGQPNGVIISYQVRDLTSDTEYNSSTIQPFLIEDLTPFTSYTFDAVVCTSVGCATSSNVSATTLEAPPLGLKQPRVVVISSQVLELYWLPPEQPNGLLQNYRLFQTKPVPVLQVYQGPGNFVRLTNLMPGERYTYQLEVSNNAGKATSAPIDIIMPLVTPLSIPPPQIVRVLNSTSIEVRWQPLNPPEGEIDLYRLLLNLGQESEITRGVGLALSHIFRSLSPYTEYEIRLQACLRNVLNGCGTSAGVIRRTLEAPPTGMQPPTVTAISSNAVRIQWAPPLLPNGAITIYRIIQQSDEDDSMEILINQVNGATLETVHSGQDLNPYSVYHFKVVAFNSVGQTESNWTSVRTLQAPPVGLQAPVIGSVSTYGVSLNWSVPAQTNGPIIAYRVYYSPNAGTSSGEGEEFVQVSGDQTSTSIGGLEAYTQYSASVEAINQAGSVRSTSVPFTTQEGYPAGLQPVTVEKLLSGRAVILSWAPPTKPNGVIVDYRIRDIDLPDTVYMGVARQFEYQRLTPFTEYTILLEACTTVGCTVSEPQTFVTAEIAPTAQPSPSFGALTATSVQLLWEPPVNPNGVIVSYEVLRAQNTARRRRDTFSTTMHVSYSDFQPIVLSSSCVQLENEFFCNDAFEILQKGAKQNVSQKIHPVHVSGDGSFDENSMLLLSRNKRARTDPVVVYRTTDTGEPSYNYTDNNLEPYTDYHYSVRASNSRASTDSPWQTIQTQQAPPEGVAPPQVSHVLGNINSLSISWTPPSKINGLLQGYQLQRNDTIPFSFPAAQTGPYIDSGLAAYTVYSYKLTACTGGGCTTSDPVALRTIEAAPLSMDPPMIQPVNSSALTATWKAPLIANGEITSYVLKMDDQVVYTGLDKSFTVHGLTPFERHTFTITACTNGGCTESGEVVGNSEAAPPTDLAPPILRVLSSRSIEVTWSPPANPNGIISSYDVRRDGRLIYTTSIETSGVLVTSYNDYSLEPGIEYTYTVVARNSKGSVESGPNMAVTYSASPSGLARPVLTPLSSTSIRADWLPPDRPNGVLTNYTLYQGTDVVYSGPPTQLSYTVPGLAYYTQYSFTIEACTARGCEVSPVSTARTMEAAPEGQPAPDLIALGDENGAHSGVRISWQPPAQPNGVLTHYEVHRRSVVTDDVGTIESTGDPVQIYNASATQFTDTDDQVLPYHMYQYMVVAANSVGKTGSVWTGVTTRQAAPEGVPPPVVDSTTANTITVTTPMPEVPNGIINLYRILLNGTVASSSPANSQTIGLTTPLQPFTVYELKTQACTEGGCAVSLATFATTDSATPTGLAPIEVVAINSTTVQLRWTPPTNPNGQVVRYEVYMRKPCPQTFQPFQRPCVPSAGSTIYSGLNLETEYGNLLPYTAYEFQVQAFNNKGGSGFPDWVRTETAQAAPVYVATPDLFKNDTKAMISWPTSFILNSQLREYILFADDRAVLRGIFTEGGVERQTKDQLIKFQIQVITFGGEAESPVIIFDPNAVDNQGTPTPPVEPETSASIAVYEEVWFIVIMCIVALLILIFVLALCIRNSGSKEPYVRERMPLQRHTDYRDLNNPNREVYVIDAADGSIIDTPRVMTREQLQNQQNRDNYFQGPGLGIINPAFSQDGELGRLSPSRISNSKLSRHSAKYNSADDLRWGRPYDSGMFDDDDDDSLSGQTYSYTKEQTVFTDTHL